jgi:hypothetical protein
MYLYLAIASALVLPLATARSLWSESPGSYADLMTTAFPLGNGRLGGMLPLLSCYSIEALSL